MKSFITHLECVLCHSSTIAENGDASQQVWMTCPKCGVAEGILDFHFDLPGIQASWVRRPLQDRPQNHWRYAELLPLAPSAVREDWQVGWTPIINAGRLARELGVGSVLVKDEGRNPSASFKDRASSVGVAHALQVGATSVACSSTGNAATSLACHAALAGLQANIFVPHTAPEPKLAQLLIYGANVFVVEGTYDEAYQLCSQACEHFGWYNRNCAINPVLVEGKKTAGLEIAEQTRDLGAVPDWIAVSIGDGCTIAGIWKGLLEMKELGVIDRLPRLLGVQAAEVTPIRYALDYDKLPETNEGDTLADSINVQVPRNWRKAVRALQDSQGVIQCVSDEEILTAMRLAGKHGIFSEPAAAAALAGVNAAVQARLMSPQDQVLVMNTGSGLKDIRSAIRAGGEPQHIQPKLSELEKHFSGKK